MARLTVIVNARRGNIGVAEPLLNLGDVGLMVEGVGGGRRSPRVTADLKLQLKIV
jgi:hypothetical protein